MNKLLLLSHIKGSLFVLKSSPEYNIDFIYRKKKASKLRFCSSFKIYVLMVSTLAFVFKIIRPIIFSAVKKVSFPRSRNFSIVKEFFHSQGIFSQSRNFPQSRNFSTVKEFFHSQVNFPQTRKFYLIK